MATMWIADDESRRKYARSMSSSAATTTTSGVFRRAGLREAAVLLALAWAVPFLIHLAPWSGARPLGVYLLPMFWTTFVAVYLYGGVIGLVVGLFAPAVNMVVTGLPPGKFAVESTLELAVFAFATAWLVRRAPRCGLIAPFGYVVARLAWAGWLALTDPKVPIDGLRIAGATVLRGLTNGLSGLLVLTAINVALVWFYPKPAPAKPEDSA
jgi:hypothetical protein